MTVLSEERLGALGIGEGQLGKLEARRSLPLGNSGEAVATQERQLEARHSEPQGSEPFESEDFGRTASAGGFSR